MYHNKYDITTITKKENKCHMIALSNPIKEPLQTYCSKHVLSFDLKVPTVEVTLIYNGSKFHKD